MRCEETGFLLLLLLAAPGSAQSADAACTGRVIDERGDPIAGVAVGVFEWNTFVDTKTLIAAPPAATAADGSFSVRIEDPTLVSLVLACEGRQACMLQVPGDGTSLGETLLAPGARLVGRVRDEDGRGIPGARIEVESAVVDMWAYQKRIVAGAVSGPDGIFVVPCVPRTGLKLEVKADGYRGVSRLVTQESPLDLTLTECGHARGRVVDEEGRPLVGFRVSVATVESQRVWMNGVSDASGSFAIEVPPNGPYLVTAHESRPPFRRFSSAILRGPQDGVTLKDWGAMPAARVVEVAVIDRESRRPIEAFELAPVTTDPAKLQSAYFHAVAGLQPYSGTATIFEKVDDVLGVLVRAKGYGFEIVPMPAPSEDRLVVELGPEAVVTGRVVDAETGKPMAGAAVRVLPKGPSSGTGGRAEDAGPLTDAKGEFRIGGLRPGDYGVQVHVSDRPASDVEWVTIGAGANALPPLSAPKRLWMTFEVRGDVPDGPCRQLQVHDNTTWTMGGSRRGRFDHHVAPPAPVALTRTGEFRVGPMGRKKCTMRIFVPSRTRTATGTTIVMGEVADGATVVLPDLSCVLVRGQLRPSQKLPTERVAVIARPCAEVGRRLPFDRSRPCLAGVRGDSTFEMDLPRGRYTFQLADIETGIVFHTEAEDIAVGDEPIVLEPTVHWLELALKPTAAEGDVRLSSITFSLMRPRSGDCPAMLKWSTRRNDKETGWVNCYAGETQLRWLVPAGPIEITANQASDKIKPWQNGWRNVGVASASVKITDRSHRIELDIPPLPSDAELMRRKE